MKASSTAMYERMTFQAVGSKGVGMISPRYEKPSCS